MSDEVQMTRRAVVASVAAGSLLLKVGTSGSAAAAGSARLPAPHYAPEDKFFGAAYIDVDEWREKPTRFRYVHGGFEGTDARFSFYFPEKEKYQGRFFHTLQGGTGGSETTVLDAIAAYSDFGVVAPQALLSGFDCGGFIIESNQGHLGDDLSGVKSDHTILCYRTSEQTARFARLVAAQMYGSPPKYGYLYGGSGGAVRTINCLENVRGIWDAGMPFVCPHESSGTFFSMQADTVRLLGREKLALYNDAVEVGGSGRPFDGLNGAQAEALSVMYKSGHSRHIGLDNPVEQVLVWAYTAWDMDQGDPGYWEDFWTKPGYMGHDSPHELEADHIEVKTRVRRVLSARELQDYTPAMHVTDELGMGPQVVQLILRLNPRGPHAPAAVILEGGHDRLARTGCASLIFTSGAAKGRERFVFGVIGDALVAGGNGKELLEGVKAGDQVTLNNRKYLSFCHHWRYQVEPKFREWAHSVVDGRPIYVQRPKLPRITSMYPHSYDFGPRKVMIMENLMDRGTWPSCAAAVHDQLLTVRGEQWVRDNCRIYYNDHAWHGAVTANIPGAPPPQLTTILIDYQGILYRALRDLVSWVEHGTTPPPATRYDYTRDCNIVVPVTAAERLGLQPVVALTGNGQSGRVEIRAGESVNFVTDAEVPPGIGGIVSAEFDFDGAGLFAYKHAVDGKSAKLQFQAAHRYTQPGTYYACVRVISQPAGDVHSPLYRAPNLGRIRVVVA